MKRQTRFLARNRALTIPPFRFFLSHRLAAIFALNMQTAIVAYWVYELTGSVVSLGKLGLCEAIPAIGLSLISGHIIDHAEKRRALLLCLASYVAISLFLCWLAFSAVSGKLPFIYGAVVAGGVIRAFVSPASFTLIGLLVPRRFLANAATWSSTFWQLGAIIGPLFSGFAIAWFAISGALIIPAALMALSFVSIWQLPKQPILARAREPIVQSLRTGLRYIGSSQILLTVLLLDLFAVLLGGATALLPAFAREVLHVDEVGFGWLRAANGIGAVLVYMILAVKPLKHRPGVKMLVCVAGYGVCMVFFGWSHSFLFSFVCLALSGALDAVSVVVRSVILQLYTPEEMRGRVGAVNTMFISSSNELGEVESGYTAEWFGLRRAVMLGGTATVAVVAAAWALAPKLRKLNF